MVSPLRCSVSSSVKVTVRLCGSGIQAVISAAEQIQLGAGRLYLTGGTENMSQCPHVIRGARRGFKLGQGKLEEVEAQLASEDGARAGARPVFLVDAVLHDVAEEIEVKLREALGLLPVAGEDKPAAEESEEETASSEA